MQQVTTRSSHKEISVARITTLIIFGLLFGVLFNILLSVSLSFYILPLTFALALGITGYIWKVSVYEPLSLEGFGAMEWILWLALSVIITPFVTGTIGYYMYKSGNRYPMKWKHLNIALIAGLIIDFALYYTFLREV